MIKITSCSMANHRLHQYSISEALHWQWFGVLCHISNVSATFQWYLHHWIRHTLIPTFSFIPCDLKWPTLSCDIKITFSLPTRAGAKFMFTSLYSIRPMTAGWQIKCIKDDFYEAWTYKHWHFQKVIVSVNLGRSKLKHSEDYMHEILKLT